MIKHCVVNVAVGPGHVRGQQRLMESLRVQKYRGDFISWTDAYPPGSPTHAQTPYAFKFFALKEAVRRGYDVICWLDASFWAVADPMIVFREISRQGYALWLSGWTVGNWCKDSALPALGVTREEALKIPLVMGGAVGIDMNNPLGRSLLDQMLRYAQDGISFPGPWDNKERKASSDPRVYGHRHDMPALSVAAHRLGMNIFSCPHLVAYWSETISPNTVLVCKGMV